jgi:hypothetical protein
MNRLQDPTLISRGSMLIAGPIVSCRGVGYEHLELLRSQSERVLCDVGQWVGLTDRYSVGFSSVPKDAHTPMLTCTDGLEHMVIVGFEVQDLHGLPVGVVGIALPATTYAVFTHTGSPVSMLEETIRPAYRWVRDSQLELNGAFDVEHENEDFLDKGLNPLARSYFWLPVRNAVAESV